MGRLLNSELSHRHVLRTRTGLDEEIAWHWMVLLDCLPDYSRSAYFCDVWVRCRRMWINCRWLDLYANNHSGIRRDCAHLIGECRLLVVLIEGPDLRSLNAEMVSETSEIGVQGCLEADRLWLVSTLCGKWLAVAEGNTHPRLIALLTKTPAGEQSPHGL